MSKLRKLKEKKRLEEEAAWSEYVAAKRVEEVKEEKVTRRRS